MSCKSLPRRTSLQLAQQDSQNEPPTPIIIGSQKDLGRKGGLKPEDKRMYSQKSIPSENKIPTLKSIKSQRSIQFKNSNQFQRFTYVKEKQRERADEEEGHGWRQRKRDCAIM